MTRNNYEVVQQIGEGGEGNVYLIREREIERLIALKVMPIWVEEKRLSYERQVKLLKENGGGYFPLLLFAYKEQGYGYIYMEYIEGKTLQTILDERRVLQKEEAVHLLLEVGKALTILHQSKEPVIFGDLKPENIIIERNGKVRLIDFGGSMPVGWENTGKRAGTFGYAPKEQWELGEKADVWWDVYALNQIFHQVLTGNNPAIPPYVTPPISTFDVTLPKTWEKTIEDYHSGKGCRGSSVEQYCNCIQSYQKREFIFRIKNILLYFVYWVTIGVSIFMLYREIWGKTWEQIIETPNQILYKGGFLLVAWILSHMVEKFRYKYKGHFQREKNIWKSAKHQTGMMIILFVFLIGVGSLPGNTNVKAEEKIRERLLPLIVYNDKKETICVPEDYVLDINKNFHLEVPISYFDGKGLVEITVMGKNTESGEILERSILVRGEKISLESD